MFSTDNIYSKLRAINLGHDGTLEASDAPSCRNQQLDNHYCKRSANSLANILAKLDAPIIASNASALPFQARDIYIDERDRANAYTGPFFKDPVRV